MKKAIHVIALISALACPLTGAEQKALSNADVLKMIKADLPESTVILAIQNSPSNFDTSPDGLIGLKSGGASAAIIDAVLVGGKKAPDTGPEPPTEADLDTALKGIARQQSGGVVSVAALKKTDGQPQVDKGVHSYAMAFETLVQFSDDCIWLHVNIDRDLKFRVARRERGKTGGWDEFLYITTNPGVQVKRASVFRVKGRAIFEKSEVGWRVVRLFQESIEASSAAAIAQIEAERNSFRLGDAATVTREIIEQLVSSADVAEPGENFTSRNRKVSASCPAGFKIQMGNDDVLGKFVAPEGGPLADMITVTCGATGLLNRNQSLDDAVRQTIASIRSSYRGAVVTGAVKTKLAGADAETFAATVFENGGVRQKAITVAVRDKHVLGVVLHSTPEKFPEAWKAYKLVCDSYAFTPK